MKLKMIFLKILILPALILIQACGGDDGSGQLQSFQAPSPGYALFWGSCDNTGEIEETVVKETFSFTNQDNEDLKTTCREWYGEFFASINLVQACNSVINGVLSDDKCDENELIGVCSVPVGIESETRYFYYKKDWLSINAAKDCESKDINAQWLELSNES